MRKYENAYSVMSLLFECVCINFLFILGIICGLGIFGIGPSLIAGHEAFKGYHLKKEEDGVVKKFISSYKKNFIIGNKLALPIIVVIIFFQIDMRILDRIDLLDNIVVLPLLSIFQLICIGTICCIFPMYSFYHLKTKEYFTKGVAYLFSKIIVLLVSLLWLGFCVYGSYLLPGLIPFLSFGIWLFGNSAIFFKSFEKNEQILEND